MNFILTNLIKIETHSLRYWLESEWSNTVKFIVYNVYKCINYHSKFTKIYLKPVCFQLNILFQKLHLNTSPEMRLLS